MEADLLSSLHISAHPLRFLLIDSCFEQSAQALASNVITVLLNLAKTDKAISLCMTRALDVSQARFIG